MPRGVVGRESGKRNGTDLGLHKDFGFYSEYSGGNLLQAFRKRTAMI